MSDPNVQFPLLDTLDLEILMHRDAHFGGNFEVMIEYYGKDQVGVMPDFEEKRIRELAHIEKEVGQNLSDEVLPEPARVQVERSKQLYLDLREIYEQENPNRHALMISNLVLSESQDPTDEIQAILDEGREMVPLLIDLISSDSFYDPLFPGYGRTPIFAARCLAKLQDEEAIPKLFNAMGFDSFFTDEAMITAIRSFGEKAKPFLFKALETKPISKNNEHAAICLMEYSEDEGVAKHCLKMLKDPDNQKNIPFATYLVFGCTALTDSTDREAFKEIFSSLDAKSDLFHEMNIIIKSWK